MREHREALIKKAIALNPDAYAIMRWARVWDDLQRLGVPGIRGIYAHPAAALGWGMLVVSIAQQYPGHVAQVLALAGQCPAAAYYTKWIIAVDEDVDTDLNQVLWALSTRCSPADDIDIQRNTWSTGSTQARSNRSCGPTWVRQLLDERLQELELPWKPFNGELDRFPKQRFRTHGTNYKNWWINAEYFRSWFSDTQAEVEMALRLLFEAGHLIPPPFWVFPRGALCRASAEMELTGPQENWLLQAPVQ